jgi:hypothetical protein
MFTELPFTVTDTEGEGKVPGEKKRGVGGEVSFERRYAVGDYIVSAQVF